MSTCLYWVIQAQLKLRLNRTQERQLSEWLPILGSVWNFGLRKIEINAKDSIYFSLHDFQNLLANHGPKLGIPSHTLQGVLSWIHTSWQRCFKKLARKPRFKGVRNKLNSIPFPDPLRAPVGNHISVPGIGRVRFHKQAIPAGKIKCGRIVKRASGWHLCLFMDAAPNAIPVVANGSIGIDPGFSSLLTFSTGEKIEHPRELEALAERLVQAQRGGRQKLSRRIQERIASQRKNRNHKLSRRLVSENAVIRFSADHHAQVAHKFGKSVASSGHGQFRQMLAYKSRAGGRAYDEPDSRNSTRICSTCGALTGPKGWAGLSVRQWTCTECGSSHDRDVNAAINTLYAGAGCAHERDRNI
ncbi:MAG TPA: transposase [Bryobacteraceae bacterium]